MPPKGCRNKAPVKGSSSKTSKSARDENLPINPSVQPLCILKAPAKTFIDGIPFNAFPTKFCRDLYTKVFRQRFLVLKRKLHLESFLNTPIPVLFVGLGWLPLANFSGTTCAPLSYLMSSLFGIIVKVTPEVIAEVLGIPLVEAPFVSDLEITSKLLDRVSIDLWGEVRGQLGLVVHTGSISRPAWVLATLLSFSVYPSSHRATICKKGGILLSRILHREPINLTSCILDEMIIRGDPTMSKKEIKGALGSKKKVGHSKDKRKFAGSDSDSNVDSSVLAQLCARFDALDEKISAQSTLLSEQISQLQSYMERGFSLIDGQMLCNMDQLHALEDLDSFLSYVLCLSCSFCSYYVHGLFWTTLCLILGQKRGDILHLTCS
ncbi:hypothetical protein PVL29_027200 [Vitis rotundifolia]|uniref:Uncharacterized protein n=1 Tax=Vitis rotundifolia TaxID=103349 RepID=A0AA38YIL1_VITRO|nr:hypothetical protein PVL29_027200 [Vitis rotundifolia]